MNSAARKKILIVDDQVDLLETLRESLAESDYDVTTTENGKQALESIEKQGVPDLILLDMKMPVMDGWEFSQKFNDLYGRACPIVIMTGMEDSSIRAMEMGADSYLGKPFDLKTLHRTVENMLA